MASPKRSTETPVQGAGLDSDDAPLGLPGDFDDANSVSPVSPDDRVTPAGREHLDNQTQREQMQARKRRKLDSGLATSAVGVLTDEDEEVSDEDTDVIAIRDNVSEEDEFDSTDELDAAALSFSTMDPKLLKPKVVMLHDAYHHKRWIRDMELAGYMTPGIAAVTRDGRCFTKGLKEDSAYHYFRLYDEFYDSYTEHGRPATKISTTKLRDWKRDFALLSAEGPLQPCWAKMKAVLEAANDNMYPPLCQPTLEKLFEQGAAELVYRYHIATLVLEQLRAGKGIAPLTASQVMALILYLRGQPSDLPRREMGADLIFVKCMLDDGEFDDPRVLNELDKLCKRDIYAGEWGCQVGMLPLAPVAAAAAKQMNQVMELDESKQRLKVEVYPLPSYPAAMHEDLVMLTRKMVVYQQQNQD